MSASVAGSHYVDYPTCSKMKDTPVWTADTCTDAKLTAVDAPAAETPACVDLAAWPWTALADRYNLEFLDCGGTDISVNIFERYDAI